MQPHRAVSQLAPLSAIAIALATFSTGHAQHYCLPPYCKTKHASIGKYTNSASDPRACYVWFFKYLNNVVPGSHNKGQGYWNTTSIQGQPIVETYDTSKTDLLAMEDNECALTRGLGVNSTRPMTPEEKALVAKHQRMPTGELHQCPCSETGRAHIINATNRNSVTAQRFAGNVRDVPPISQPESNFIEEGGFNQIFGLHTVKCGFHSSGPCLLDEIERGVARTWHGNFSKGYVPLMNNNVMLFTPTLGPLLDLFLKDDIDFYPMRWKAPTENGMRDVFSVMASPCGKMLIEVAAPDAGGRAVEQFHEMPMARAVFKDWNAPADQPLVPLRISRAVTPDLMDKMLEFYGVTGVESAARLGFRTKVLLDETVKDGTRVVTLKLSDSATVHMQIWAIPEIPETQPWKPNPVGGFAQDFRDSKGINQVTGKALERAQDFCESGKWSVARYTWYVLQTHEATLGPIPTNTSTLTPPAGNDMNSFFDDHFSWDCTAEECEISAATRALFDAGSHITFNTFKQWWWPYSHDPAGYGIELHWANVVKSFQPQGYVPQICFLTNADGTCPGSSPSVTEFVV